MSIFGKEKSDKKPEVVKKSEDLKKTEAVKEPEDLKKTEAVKEETKTFKNNSAFKRAMVQMGVEPGQKITVSFADGSTYTVERK